MRLTELEADIDQPVESIDIAEVFGGQEAKSLLTVIELLSPGEAAVEGTGRVSLMVIDTRGKSPRKVQRWDFSPEEAADAWQSTPLGTGFHLELPLQAKLPETGGLELWARVTLDDGRKVLTRRPLQPSELLSVEAALAAEPLPAPPQEKWQARDSKPVESKLAVVEKKPVAAPVEVALVEPSRRESVEVEPERSRPRSVGSAEVRIVTTPIPEERLQKTRDGWRASDEKRPRPPEVARAMAAVRGEDARWKKARARPRSRPTPRAYRSGRRTVESGGPVVDLAKTPRQTLCLSGFFYLFWRENGKHVLGGQNSGYCPALVSGVPCFSG